MNRASYQNIGKVTPNSTVIIHCRCKFVRDVLDQDMFRAHSLFIREIFIAWQITLSMLLHAVLYELLVEWIRRNATAVADASLARGWLCAARSNVSVTAVAWCGVETSHCLEDTRRPRAAAADRPTNDSIDLLAHGPAVEERRRCPHAKPGGREPAWPGASASTTAARIDSAANAFVRAPQQANGGRSDASRTQSVGSAGVRAGRALKRSDAAAAAADRRVAAADERSRRHR